MAKNTENLSNEQNKKKTFHQNQFAYMDVITIFRSRLNHNKLQPRDIIVTFYGRRVRQRL